jgi:hypothetical protein
MGCSAMAVVRAVAILLAFSFATAVANAATYQIVGNGCSPCGGHVNVGTGLTGTINVNDATGQIISSDIVITSTFSESLIVPPFFESGSGTITDTNLGASPGPTNNSTWIFVTLPYLQIVVDVPNPNPDGVSWTPFAEASISGVTDIPCTQGACIGAELDAPFTGTLTATPLPTTFPLLATALGALGLLGWRSKRVVHSKNPRCCQPDFSAP